MNKYYLFLVVSLLLCLPTTYALAQTPAVSSISAVPSSIGNGQATLISWNLSEGNGHSLYFFCPTAVKIKKLDGSSFPCNARQSVNSNPSASETFLITNASGSTQSMRIRVYPKDTNGVDYDAGSRDTYVDVGSNPNPISDFTVSSSTVMSGSTVTLSWAGSADLSGANLRFDCVSDVTIVGVSPAVNGTLPCNVTAYAAGLGTSGSVTVIFANDSLFPRTMYASVLPAPSAGAYDATHGKSLTFEISGRKLPPSPSIDSFLVDSFSVSRATVLSEKSVIFLWTSQHTIGVNFKFPCTDKLTVSEVRSTTTVSLPCVSYAFPKVLPVSGSITISFLNKTYSPQAFSMSIVPQIADGTYDATKGRTVNITVLAPGSTSTQGGGNISAVVVPPVSNTQQPLAGAVKVIHNVQFSRFMQKGTKHDQVVELQKVLAQDPMLYPEGLVTGYFGSLTDLAIKRFQKRYGIAKEGDEGYGLVGPKTRAKLNTLVYF